MDFYLEQAEATRGIHPLYSENQQTWIVLYSTIYHGIGRGVFEMMLSTWKQRPKSLALILVR